MQLMEWNDGGVEEQVTALRNALEALADGESLELIGSGSSQEMITTLQAQRWGYYDCYPLPAQSGWRLQIFNHAAPEQPRRVVGFFTFDHRRCDQLFADMEIAAKEGSTPEAKGLFNAFEMGMQFHFKMEEEVLFPTFESRAGMPPNQGPTMVMRMEHQQMRGLLQQMREAADKDDLAQLASVGGTLLFLMQQHNMKEEQMLYPACDAHLGPVVDEVLQRAQGLLARIFHEG
uniref:Hemerythrin-like domain-containing protein n=1 Tax=Magnetococcus massalia (strain MO-1) TaxID=451514 RepID=A0A1S7LGC9_MAGMO|nr:conserved protein of unknown function; [Haemerythrin/HHE cation-binding motif] [Candidatus Magnetococcus massalia]